MLEGIINKFRLSEEEEDDYELEDDREYGRPSKPSNEPKVKEFPKQRSEYAESDRANIVISRPKKIDDAKDIIDQLMSGSSVTIDLEKVEGPLKQRIMDMVVGYGYCANCNIEQVNDNIFVISHVDIRVNE